jgi:predicted transcriptional regulator of viral defense system
MIETHDGFDFNVRSLGSIEAMIVLSAEEQKKRDVDVAFAAHLVGDRDQAVRALQRLERKGWVKRLSPGRYLLIGAKYGHLNVGFIPENVFATSLVPGSYVGWWSAAAYHGLSWQRPFTIFVASEFQKREREFEGHRIVFVKQGQARFFGVETDAYEAFPVSSISKTIADCVDRIDLSGGPAEVGIILGFGVDQVGLRSIFDDAVQLNSASVLQRLGFLLDTIRPDVFDADIRSELRARIKPSHRSVFGRKVFEDGDYGYVRDWGLQVNINAAMFRGETDRFGKPKFLPPAATG